MHFPTNILIANAAKTTVSSNFAEYFFKCINAFTISQICPCLVWILTSFILQPVKYQIFASNLAPSAPILRSRVFIRFSCLQLENMDKCVQVTDPSQSNCSLNKLFLLLTLLQLHQYFRYSHHFLPSVSRVALVVYCR